MKTTVELHCVSLTWAYMATKKETKKRTPQQRVTTSSELKSTLPRVRGSDAEVETALDPSSTETELSLIEEERVE